MKKLFPGIVVALSLAACDSAGDTSCAACGMSLSDTECNSIALAAGCTSGMSSADNRCTMPTRGCQFRGCPTGTAVMCMLPSDSGAPADAATGDATRD